MGDAKLIRSRDLGENFECKFPVEHTLFVVVCCHGCVAQMLDCLLLNCEAAQSLSAASSFFFQVCLDNYCKDNLNVDLSGFSVANVIIII